MSWSSYISDQLVGSGNVTKAAIHGLDGNCWASSDTLKVTPEEVLKMVNGFSNQDELRASGLMIGGTKFFFLSAADGVLRGKKGTQGCHICKTNTGVIIAIYEEPIQPGQCANTVESLADYLKGVNY